MLVAEGVGIAEISRVMGKTRVSVRSKMYHLGFSLVDAAAVFPTIAASVASTTDPIIDNAPLYDAPSQVPLIDHQPAADSASLPSEVDAFAAQLKKNEPLPNIKEKLRVLDAALGH